MSIVLKLQKLSLASIHNEMNLELNSAVSLVCPLTNLGGNSQFEME